MQVKVDPLVQVQVLDHHSRRSSADTGRVVGVLLGSKSGAKQMVTVKRAFPLWQGVSDPAEQQQPMDADAFQQIMNLFLMANPKEKVVGWYICAAGLFTLSFLSYVQHYLSYHMHRYSTSTTLDNETAETHRFLSMQVNSNSVSDFAATSARVRDSLVHLVVDPEFEQAMRAYSCTPLGLDQGIPADDAAEEQAAGISCIFRPLSCSSLPVESAKLYGTCPAHALQHFCPQE